MLVAYILSSGNVTIQATGAGKDSNLTVQGSSVQAAGTTRLQADNQVNLLAAQNTTSESSSNQSKSGSVGVQRSWATVEVVSASRPVSAKPQAKARATVSRSPTRKWRATR